MRKKIQMNKVNDTKTFAQGYDEFIIYCKARNLSPATIKHYNGSIIVWYKFFDYKTPIKDITRETVQNFILFMQKKMHENDVTMNTNLRSMRAILYYFMKLGYMEEFKISELKVTKEPIDTYTDAELKILLEKPNIKKCSFVEYRNWVIVNFLMATGARVKTIANLKIEDLDFENDVMRYTHTKNRRGQIVPMSYNLKNILIEYLQYRGASSPEDYVFVSAYGGKLNTNTLSQNMCAYNRKRGVCKTGLHRYRHTFAKKWILGGGDVFRLQKMLGHSSMTIVKNYVNMFSYDLQKDFNTFNPLENLINKKQHIKMR